jgi:hypothetical protein
MDRRVLKYRSDPLYLLMAEPTTIVRMIGGILKVFVRCFSPAKVIFSAFRKAQGTMVLLWATNAILKSMKATLRAERQPQYFLDIWNVPTKQVLANVKTAVQQLYEILDGKNAKLARLSFCAKLIYH